MKKGKIFYAVSISFMLLFSGMETQAQHFNDKLFSVLRYINAHYVDTVSEDVLVEEAIKAMLKQLDPHSVYFDKSQVKDINNRLMGQFEGVGLHYDFLRDSLIIISVVKGGPSDKAGILPLDRIVKADTAKLLGANLNLKYIKLLLQGKKGSVLKVQVKRPGVTELLDFEIFRDVIPIPSIDCAYMADTITGYIRINRFAANTVSEFNMHIEKLRAQGMEQLVLDLRDNGGGLLDASLQMADQFLDNDKLIVYFEGKNVSRTLYKSSVPGNVEKGKVLVLVNENSASASEILAGAIQDWDRGIIAGRRSYGKGLIQRPFNLPDGSMVRITTARYFTPSGRSIQKPYGKDFNEYELDLAHRMQSGEYEDQTKYNNTDTLKHLTKLNQRVVFGGGGIWPDIFIPIDSSRFTQFHRQFLSRNILNKFVFQYFNDNHAYLNRNFKTFNEYSQRFDFTSDDSIQYLNMARAEFANTGYASTFDACWQQSSEKILIQTKAQLARFLWSLNEYHMYMNFTDPDVCKALDIINNQSLYYITLKSITSENE